MVALLNHDRVWILNQFEKDVFFEGKLKSIEFEHNSQKEGVYIKTNNTLIISDERNKDEGGFIYEFKLK